MPFFLSIFIITNSFCKLLSRITNEWATFVLCGGIHGSRWIMGRLHSAIFPSQPSYYLFLISIKPLKMELCRMILFSIWPIISWQPQAILTFILMEPYSSNTFSSNYKQQQQLENTKSASKPNFYGLTISMTLFSQWTAFQQAFQWLATNKQHFVSKLIHK